MLVVWNTLRNTYNIFKLQGTRRQVTVHFTHSPRIYARGTQIFQKSRSHLRTLSTRRVTQSKFHSKGPKILGATEQNSVARATWWPGFVQHCILVPLTTAHFSENIPDFMKLGVANVNPWTVTSIVHIPQNTYVCYSECISFIFLLFLCETAHEQRNIKIIQYVNRSCKNGKLVRMWKISWSTVKR